MAGAWTTSPPPRIGRRTLNEKIVKLGIEKSQVLMS
jgi:hypothetical protein